jgi:hypothetical protein
LVVTVKVAVVALAGIVTLAGTCAAAVLLLDNVTTASVAGAGPLSVTVPVDEVPPITEAGLTVTDVKVAAVTVRLAVRVVPRTPEIVAVVVVATGLVATLNVAVVAPAGTEILAGV